MFKATVYVLESLFRPNRQVKELAEAFRLRMEGEKAARKARNELAALKKPVYDPR